MNKATFNAQKVEVHAHRLVLRCSRITRSPELGDIYPPIVGGAHAQKPLPALLWRALSGAQRPTRLLIGLPGGLSSAIFAKGTKGALVAFTVRAEAPPHSGF